MLDIDMGRFAYNLNQEQIYIDYLNQWGQKFPTKNEVYNLLESYFDNYAYKIYKIISEHSRIDISEDEFIRLLEEDKNDWKIKRPDDQS